MKIKLKPYIIPAVVFTLIVFGGVYFSRWLDDTLPQVEAWLSTNQTLIGEIGSIEDIDIVKTTRVSESSGSPGFKKYTFFAKGSKGEAIIRVRVSADGEYEIVGIE